MKTVFLRSGPSGGILLSLISLIVVIATSTQADQVEMQNGDRYSGKVVTLNSNMVVLKSDVLGTVRIRRDRIATLSFGATPTAGTAQTGVPKAPPIPVISPSVGPNPQIDLNSSFSHQIAANPNLVNEVRNQMLAGASPKALQKYDALVSGLSSGNLDVAGLRKEAASVAAQLRQLRGSEEDDVLDEYLSVLDSFVDETKTAALATKPTDAAKPTVVKPTKSSPSAATAKPTTSSTLNDE